MQQETDKDMPTVEPGPVSSLPGYGSVKEAQIAGSLPIAGGGANLFFWLIESQRDPENDPLVLWLNGGPGSSSFIGFFNENGPYKIEQAAEAGEVELVDNPYSWNKHATYMIIDQLAGVGLSGIHSSSLYAPNESVATNQLYLMLIDFFTRYPEYSKLPFYLFGESFAGHYLPTLAHAILDGNKLGYFHINLKGIGLGDGWVDPLTLQQTYPDYAYAQGLICLNEKTRAEELYRECAAAVLDSMPIPSADSDKTCELIEAYIVKAAGGINVYDVRAFGDYEYSIIGEYLNRPDVRAALNVDPSALPWVDESPIVADLLETGEQSSSAYLFPRLFDELRVLIYNGVYDMDCNFMGTDIWLQNLKWSYGDEFKSKSRRPWKIENAVVGHARSVESLTQLVILNCGHLVPMDQPKVALEMLDRFLDGRQFIEPET
jgi:carboxypeptidase C (cathepsin A)